MTLAPARNLIPLIVSDELNAYGDKMQWSEADRLVAETTLTFMALHPQHCINIGPKNIGVKFDVLKEYLQDRLVGNADDHANRPLTVLPEHCQAVVSDTLRFDQEIATYRADIYGALASGDATPNMVVGPRNDI